MAKVNYEELYKRNWPIISKLIQTELKNLKVAVAGCGSTGGAFIDGLLRLGIEKYHLCDNGSYELNNLNRQMVFLNNINLNKAESYKERILNVNPHAEVTVWSSGLTLENLDNFLSDVDFVFDAVDVTTASGMEMKFALHCAAHEKKKPTGSALDLGFTQWLQSYNYHQGEQLLKGNYAKAKACKHPLKAAIEAFSPIDHLPYEITIELLRLIRNPNESACQLACVCFALSGMVTPYLISFLKKGRLPELTTIDLIGLFEDEREQKERERLTREAHLELSAELLKLH